MAENTIMYDGILTPQTYLETITGKYFCLNSDNQIELVEKILDEQCGKGQYWSFAFDDIEEIMQNGHKVVLVELVNVVYKNNIAEQEKLYRWFEVPEEWTKEIVENRLKEI